MKKIIFPKRLRMKRSEVADLQDALQLCLDRSAVLANDAAARRELSAALKPESDRQTYGSATRKLVSIFQEERRLFGPTGAPRDEVDEPAANALNALLKELGVLDQPAEPALLGYYVEGKVASRISASVVVCASISWIKGWRRCEPRRSHQQRGWRISDNIYRAAHEGPESLQNLII